MEKKYCAITFDDGPNEFTVAITNKFIEYGGKASFMVMGDRINDQTEKYLKYAIDKGFLLASHSQTHAHLEFLSYDEAKNELTAPVKELKKRFNYSTCYARVPYIIYSNKSLKAAKDAGLILCGTDIDGGADWDPNVTPEHIAKHVLSYFADGAIACLHVTENTLKALDIILPELKNRGFEFLTVDDLLKVKNKKAPFGINIDNVNDL